MASDIRILVADDHAAVADSLSFTLAQWYDVLPPVYSLRALTSLTWASPSPDVILLDLSFGSGSALGILPSLIERHRDVAFVICTMHDEVVLAEAALSAGASGYIVKTCGLDEFRNVIDAAAAGQETVRGCTCPPPPPPQREAALRPRHPLTSRQAQVLRLKQRSFTNHAIAVKLRVSEKAIEKVCRNLRRTLGIPPGERCDWHLVPTHPPSTSSRNPGIDPVSHRRTLDER